MKFLETDAARDRFFANLRAAQWEVWPSVINLLEAVKTKNATVRDRLLGTLRALNADRPLLPWPHEVLKQAGLAIVRGERRFLIGQTGFNWILEDPTKLTAGDIQRAKDFLDNRERYFDDLLEDARGTLQPYLKEKGLRYAWQTAQDFLDQQWNTPGHLTSYVEKLWDKLDLPGPAPVTAVLQDEAWRLFFDAHGIAAFERSIKVRRSKRVQEADLLQLVYMAGSPRRLLVTDDQSFTRAADLVLRRRYPRAEVVHIERMVE